MNADGCEPMAWRLLNVKQVAERCGVQPRTVRAWVDGERGDRTFPRPIVRGWWDVCEVDAWLVDHPSVGDHNP